MSRMLILAAAVMFSTGGAAIKATTLASWQVAAFRSLIAALALIALVPAARRGWSRRALPAAVAYAATLVLFVLSTKLTTAANAIFLQATAPLYLLLLGPLLLREPVSRSQLIFAAPVAVGMSLFFFGSERAAGTAPDPAGGNILGVFCGISWALTLAGLRWLGKPPAGQTKPIATVVMGNLIAFLVSLPGALPVERIGARDLAALTYLGVIQVGLAYVALTRALPHVPAFEVSTLLLAEPVLNPFWAWLLHGERPSAWAMAGGSLILAATFASTWWHSRRDSY